MRRRSRRRALKWGLWIVGVLCAVLIGLALIKIDDVVMAQGHVEPGYKIYVDSPLKRVIKEIYVDQGSPVVKGQPLVRLYDNDLISDAATSEKEVRRSEANLEFAKANLALLREKPTTEELKIAESRVEQARISLEARQQELKCAEHLYLGERLWSGENLERAKTSVELAKTNLKVTKENLSLVRRGASPAELRQAEASVRQSDAALDKARNSLVASREALALATLRSEYDGEVVRRDLHPGMLADAGQIVLIIAGSEGGTVIDAWVPETNAWKVRLGQRVEILSNLFSDREGFLGFGRISKSSGYAVDGGGTRTFELEVAVEESPMPLKYGSTADLRIIVGRRSILKILLGIENRDFALVSTGRGSISEPERDPAGSQHKPAALDTVVSPQGNASPDSAAVLH